MRNTSQLAEFCKYGYELIRLAYKQKIPPKGYTWRKVKPELPENLNGNNNAGIRLRTTDLVCDVDPRNGGKLSMLGDVSKYPIVQTPGGGYHVYMRKPAAVKLANRIESMPGIDFLSSGHYVLSPGSVHPNGGLYEWDITSPPLPAPVAPDSIIKLLSRAEPAAGTRQADGWSPEELAAALEGLKAEDFREHDTWFQLMCACHEATVGSGVEEFIKWSTSDRRYAQDAGVIRTRWNTLKAGQTKNAGPDTLAKILSDRGALLPISIVAREFESAAGDASVSADLSVMERLSNDFRAVDEDGKLKIYTQRFDDTLNRKYWVRYNRRDFLEVCQSVMGLPHVEAGTKANGDVKLIPAGIAWLDHYRKKPCYQGVTFAPECDRERTADGKLNLWSGFAIIESESGSWELLKELIWEGLTGEDLESYEYVLNWMARAVQTPWLPAGTAIAFRGPKGTGKSTLGHAFRSLFGQHGMSVSSPSLLTGRFNSHLRDVVALLADEAFWAGDKHGEGMLKTLITERILAYEGKGQNAEMGRNYVHIIIASNENWVVPAGMDSERRFAVFDALNLNQGPKYWARLHAELANGGLQRMLWDLRRRDVHDFNPHRVPMTKALEEQKIHTMDPIALWLYEQAMNKWNDFGTDYYKNTFLRDDIYESYLRGCEERGLHSVRASRTLLGIAIKKFLPSLQKGRVYRANLAAQKYTYTLPDAVDAIKILEKLIRSVPS